MKKENLIKIIFLQVIQLNMKVSQLEKLTLDPLAVDAEAQENGEPAELAGVGDVNGVFS